MPQEKNSRLLLNLTFSLWAIAVILPPIAAWPREAVAATPKPAPTPAELSAIADAAAIEAIKARTAADRADAIAAAAGQNLRAAQAIVAALPSLATSHRSGDDAAAQQAAFQVTLAEAALQRAQQQEALALQSAAVANIATPAPGTLPTPNLMGTPAQMEVQNARQSVEAAQLNLARAQQVAAAARQSAGVNISADTASARNAELALATARSLAASAASAAAAADATADRLEAAARRARAAADAAKTPEQR